MKLAFFFPREYFGSWRTQWRQMQSGASALIYTKAPRFTQQWLLHHRCKRQHSQKGRWCASVIMKIVFTWQTPWKSLRAVDPTLRTTGLRSWELGNHLIPFSKVGDTVCKRSNRQGCSLNICRPRTKLPDSEPLGVP